MDWKILVPLCIDLREDRLDEWMGTYLEGWMNGILVGWMEDLFGFFFFLFLGWMVK